MILAAAQTKPTRWNIEKNLEDHYKFVKLAASEGTELIVFPEMSITGYEREEAAKVLFEVNDKRLERLMELAINNRMVIIAGAPIKIGINLFIGSFVIKPDGSTEIYTKHFLHPGEEISFTSSFEFDPVIEIENERISLAICADIDHPEHVGEAAKRKSSFYIPGIFFSPNGIPGAHKTLSGYAKDNNLNILMSNFGGPSWGLESGGRSAFWDDQGQLIAELPDSGEYLLIIKKQELGWITKQLNI